MPQIILIAHNLRSTHNVGSLLRTAEGLGIDRVYLTGYTPYPISDNDTRLPHEAVKLTKQISKTALGAESSDFWKHKDDIETVLREMRQEKYHIAALEQTSHSIPLISFNPPDKIALVVGREVEGIETDVITECDIVLEIPMFGKKESYNVVQAAAMALYHCKFFITR